MLRKKYEVDREFSLMMQLVGDLDDSMSELDKILADEQLFKLIESDLSLRYPKTTKTGRKSTPVEVIFRMLVLKHLRGLSYEKVILKRCFGLERCLYRGESGFSRWVGWGIITHNLTIMTRILIKNESEKNQKHKS